VNCTAEITNIENIAYQGKIWIDFLSIESQLWKFAHSKLMSSLCSLRNFVTVRPGFAMKLSHNVLSMFVYFWPWLYSHKKSTDTPNKFLWSIIRYPVTSDYWKFCTSCIIGIRSSVSFLKNQRQTNSEISGF